MNKLRLLFVILLFNLSFTQNAKAQTLGSIDLDCSRLQSDIISFYGSLENTLNNSIGEWIQHKSRITNDTSEYSYVIGVDSDTLVTVNFMIVNNTIRFFTQKIDAETVGLCIDGNRFGCFNPNKWEDFGGINASLTSPIAANYILFPSAGIESGKVYRLICRSQDELEDTLFDH